MDGLTIVIVNILLAVGNFAVFFQADNRFRWVNLLAGFIATFSVIGSMFGGAA